MSRLFRMFWFKHFLGSYQWYRKWYGGRWERHWIDICGAFIWLDVEPDKHWPFYRQPCSFGTPTIEDWPTKDFK